MARVSYPSLEHVAMEKCRYPAELLEGAESGLILFAAAFLGRNDAIHFAEAGVPNVTLVDIDGERLREMADLYRDPTWTFSEADAFAFARFARLVGSKWDVVSVDTFTGTATDRSLNELEQWTEIANRAVVATIAGAGAVVPSGWTWSIVEREGPTDANWLVLEVAS